MREIKFRAWGKIDHKMHNPGKLNACLSHFNPKSIPMWWKSDGDEVVWMQWAGLLDSRGKEIYEGDIVNLLPHGYLPFYSPVYFNNGSFMVKTGKDNVFLGGIPRDRESTELLSCIVSGNIYENPQLLSAPQ